VQVLVIGYGKIGQIKALLWRSLGAVVYVYDINPSVIQKALDDGYKSYVGRIPDQELIVDISSPAGQHYISLQWLVDNISSPLQYILIEKPLVSSVEELTKFTSISESLRSKLILNESYFSSRGLRKLVDSVNEKPLHVEIELSKNRLDDIANGRFFDYKLGAIGIETPHMLAILQMLDLSIHNIDISEANLYVDSKQTENQGFEIFFTTNGTSVVLRSFLGDFSSTNSQIIKSNSTVRSINIHTKLRDFRLEFDPAPKLPRYHSRLTIRRINENKESVSEFADDHLREHMVQFQNKDPVNPLIMFNNAVHLSTVLHTLKDSVKVIDVPARTAEISQQIITQEGV